MRSYLSAVTPNCRQTGVRSECPLSANSGHSLDESIGARVEYPRAFDRPELPSALHMSAFDPKPTLLFFATTPHQRGVSYKGLGPPVASRR
jgi:hypothetical protein